jgi:Brp/Blh family beta-carotene 15,15'-monooxygenase
MFFSQNFILETPLYFLRGLIIISAPLYLNNVETVNFINILLLGEQWINLETAIYSYIFYFNLVLIFFLTLLFWIRKNINLKDFFIISFEVLSIVIIFKYLPLILAFTMYFCFMHSTKHILSLAVELNDSNVYAGIKSFAKKAAPLTVITFAISLIMLFYLSKEFSVDKSILKIIFIGLAALTLPHIILEYIYGKYK